MIVAKENKRYRRSGGCFDLYDDTYVPKKWKGGGSSYSSKRDGDTISFFKKREKQAEKEAKLQASLQVEKSKQSLKDDMILVEFLELVKFHTEIKEAKTQLSNNAEQYAKHIDSLSDRLSQEQITALLKMVDLYKSASKERANMLKQ